MQNCGYLQLLCLRTNLVLILLGTSRRRMRHLSTFGVENSVLDVALPVKECPLKERGAR